MKLSRKGKFANDTTTTPNVIVVACVIVVVFLLSLYLLSIPTRYILEAYRDSMYLNFPTKCFSCERELPDGLKWMGQPTKCFSCEREAAAAAAKTIMESNGRDPEAASSALDNIYMTHPNKCYSCEKKY
jgi:DNA-directed RNA polymerase subunit N (RpoN/RPB10)